MKIVFFNFLKKFKVLAIIFLLAIVASSCNKQLDINSTRQANEAGHWSTYEDARAGLIGFYGLFRAAVADDNGHWLWGELRNGDFKSVTRPDLKAIIDGNLKASYPVIQTITNWRRFYAVINACNLFIERANGCLKDKRYTESYYKLDIAQARAIRSFAYFYMVRIWGDVPLITTSNDGGNFDALPRTNQDVVLSFARQELVEAAQNLPYLYSGNDPDQLFPSNYYGGTQDQWLNTPINKLAAYALLAHIAAWQGKYIDVEVYTSFIVNNFDKSNLSLVDIDGLVSPNGLFLAGNGNYNQLIGFNFIKGNGETTSSGHIEQLTLANTTLYPMSKQLPDIYVPKETISQLFPLSNGNDTRFGLDNQYTPPLNYTTYFENYNAEIPVFKKIRIVNGGSSTGNFAVYNSSIVFTRLEEIKLLYAEALAVLGQQDQAAEQLNSIRNNRGINSISPGPNVDIVDEVFAERRRELMGEGWRWYDLVRYNKIKRNNAAFNELLDKGGIYWPIAQDVINRNPKIVQNAYWQ
ncbi:MAG: RagB/SusD family nutrient uptake outer membrane protein [Bacteroidetes bacterium]|nr:RagB/SusD family nutrient uptake outer membrane protein [Bacteroidota bacterium]MBS1756670.1 RagB/SusD family nutrient uptake outer membrane protein [Bacteroidota bacterium]